MSSRSPSLPTIARAASYRRRYGRLRTSSGRDGSVASAWRALRLRAPIVTAEITLLVSACLLAACGGTAPVSAPAASLKAPPVEFRFPPTDTDLVSSETTRGRVTALAFITTYDMVSQLLVKRLGDVVVKFTPRINAAAVVMEPPVYAELLSIYREELALPFPVVMADFATQQGAGPFGAIEKVPVLVVLDRNGREVWRFQGPLETAEIEAALRRAGR